MLGTGNESDWRAIMRGQYSTNTEIATATHDMSITLGASPMTPETAPDGATFDEANARFVRACNAAGVKV
jgi:hypothetical protein